MEVIAGAASISQLVAYSLSSTRYLQKLCTELKAGGSAYRSEENNINLLLKVIKRLAAQDIEDSDPILPILIDISGLACEVLHLLRPKRFLGYNWTALITHDKISTAFEALDRKRGILHLYISQSNRETVAPIQTSSNEHRSPCTPSTMGATMSSRANISVEGNYVGGYAEAGCGFEAAEQPNLRYHSNGIPLGGTQFAGNKTENSEATRLEIHDRQVTLAHQRSATANAAKQSTPSTNGTQAPFTQAHTASSETGDSLSPVIFRQAIASGTDKQIPDVRTPARQAALEDSLNHTSTAQQYSFEREEPKSLREVGKYMQPSGIATISMIKDGTREMDSGEKGMQVKRDNETFLGGG
jgi:hypothetical protein